MTTINMAIWDELKRPPVTALKKIVGGRMSGKTDISPQWRLQAMTELFGPIGFGWSYRIERMWNEVGAGGEICAFVHITLRVKIEDMWSEPIEGIGGSMLVAAEKSGLHTSDEAYKMATTDALSVAMKQLGVAADIYLGNYDGTKYKDVVEPPKDKLLWSELISDSQLKCLCTALTNNNRDMDRFKDWLIATYQIDSKKKIPKALFDEIMAVVERK